MKNMMRNITISLNGASSASSTSSALIFIPLLTIDAIERFH